MSTRNARRHLPLTLACFLAVVVGIALFAPSGPVEAGAYISSFEGAENRITHPETYNGTGGVVNISLCISPSSAFSAQMVASVQNNVATLNALTGASPNLFLGGANNIPSGAIDFESVLIHEVGHAIGLAHVNHASESGLGSPQNNGTKSTNGPNNSWNQNAGSDGRHGSRDDLRGDDGNLHWFLDATNNPCTAASPAVVDATTMSRVLTSLPAGDLFAANADRSVCSALGAGNTEAIMQQGTGSDEDQRRLGGGDVRTLRFAMSGVDEIQGTGDDYTLNFSYAGITNACDITISFDNSVGFAATFLNDTGIAGQHRRVVNPSIHFNTGFNWFFNTATAAVCGDGNVDSGEECDDGNTTNGDGCDSNCVNEVCGNGVVQSGEQCDDGNTTSGDGCSSTCQNEFCGDGVVQGGEQCDDGNNSNGDGCDANCVSEVCGNGIVQSGEQCDDGNTNNNDGCSSTCQNEFCGDGVVQSGEQCDDGNTANGDGCDSNCVSEVCGNGILQSGEGCDDGNTTSGDGCSSTCVVEFCGDGTIQGGLGEVCDDGNMTDGDGCDSNCTPTGCGNGVVTAPEECDDGNTNDNDACANDCTVNPFANFVVNGDFSAGTAPWVFFTTGGGTYQVAGGEAKLTFTTAGLQVIFYQDNIALAPNTEYTLSFQARHSVPNKKISASFVRQTSPFPSYGLQGQSFPLTTTMQSYSVNFTTTAGVGNDGRLRFNLVSAASPGAMLWFDNISLAETTPAVCGNGVVEGGEQCDDGNTTNGDGCDSTCQIEPVCGNGIVEPGEQCDDGNTTNGDGCDSTCQIEVPVCGNGVVETGEQCDDGNTSNNDGCSSTCRNEFCGDGIVQTGEQCDDGNANDNDACANDCTINVIVPPTNLIVNGDFSAGREPWDDYSNGDMDYQVVGGEARLTFNVPGTNVQLYQTNVTVEPSTEYTLSFDARHTNSGERVDVQFQRHTSPYTNYGLRQTINNFPTTMTHYEFTFTTPSSVIPNGRLTFLVGRADEVPGSRFYVDNVVLAGTSPAVCGNGTVENGEQCDDGNTTNGDGCDSSCQIEPVCGNGVVETGEQCDDGNTTSGDGCSSTCQIEAPVCGNGVVEAGEECDDGNTTSGDGCSSTCQTEGGGGPNLIRNPNFSSGEANWRHSAGSGSSDFRVVGGQAFVEIFAGGSSLQVYQSGITLQPNTTYRLTFDGRNTGGDDIRARVIRHSSPYTNYGLNKLVNLTASMQTFTMTFTTPASVASARLQLWFLNDNPGKNYYFDNFVLELD